MIGPTGPDCTNIKLFIICFGNYCHLSDDYWQNQGPLFFYTGNEGPIEGYFNSAGFIFTLALEFNALVIFAEHVSTSLS